MSMFLLSRLSLAGSLLGANLHEFMLTLIGSAGFHLTCVPATSKNQESISFLKAPTVNNLDGSIGQAQDSSLSFNNRGLSSYSRPINWSSSGQFLTFLLQAQDRISEPWAKVRRSLMQHDFSVSNSKSLGQTFFKGWLPTQTSFQRLVEESFPMVCLKIEWMLTLSLLSGRESRIIALHRPDFELGIDWCSKPPRSPWMDFIMLLHNTFGSTRKRHHHFAVIARLLARRLPIPSPPFFNGEHTLFQAIHAIFLSLTNHPKRKIY